MTLTVNDQLFIKPPKPLWRTIDGMDAAEIVRRAVDSGAFKYPEPKEPPKQRAKGGGRKPWATPEQKATVKARKIEYQRAYRKKQQKLKCG